MTAPAIVAFEEERPAWTAYCQMHRSLFPCAARRDLIERTSCAI